MHCRRNDQDMTKIIRKMYRADNVERIKERRKTYDEAKQEN